MMRLRFFTVAAVLAATQLLSGCYLWTNEDSTTAPPVTLPPSTETGILLALNDFDAYIGQPMAARLVGGDGTVLSLVRVASLDSANYRLELVSVPSKPASRVDLYTDTDGDGWYSPADDVLWIAPLRTNRTAVFEAANVRTNLGGELEPGGDFELRLTGFGSYEGSRIRIALQNWVDQITGLYSGYVDGDDFVVRLPGVVVETQPYRISLYVDANNNNRYDAPPLDPAWQLFTTGEPDGISLELAYNEDFDDVDFEPR